MVYIACTGYIRCWTNTKISCGINFRIIKDFWEELKSDSTRLLSSEFHRNGSLVKGLNCMFIALISKVENSELLLEFRLVYLVSCVYKVLVKVLPNRLKKFIGSLVSDIQLAFINDRQILDGVLVVNEVVDETHKFKKKLLMFLVDFEKTYDDSWMAYNWFFFFYKSHLHILDGVMDKMKFHVS